MLKIFKDIMQRENHDPEKANLLKEQTEDRKRKPYAGSRSRSKSEHRSYDSSNVERPKRNIPHQIQEQRNVGYDQFRTQSIPFQEDKKDSWWFWGEKEKSPDDTCSCVSCALKKLAGSEYACVGCLLLIFTISVIVAFLLVFRSVPTLINENQAPKPMSKLESERLKRKIDYFKDKNNYRNGYAGLKEDFHDRRNWDDTLSRQLDGLSELYGLDSDTSGFGELINTNPEEAGSISSDLSRVLDSDKVNEFQNSERLREFYKKILQADAQIKVLKKGLTDFTLLNTNTDFKMKPFDRSKRSLKHSTIIKNKIKNLIGTGNLNKTITKPQIHGDKYARNKRYNNETKPTGFVIEKKKLIVQYKPNENNIEISKKVPKCSHMPKESKSHEKQLKHPFYKNSQRVDKLLDHFLDKNLPEISADPFNIDLFNNEKKQCKHPKTDENMEFFKPDKKGLNIDKEKKSKDDGKIDDEVLKNLQPESTSLNTKEYLGHILNNVEKKRKSVETSTDDYNVIQSISTILNPRAKRAEILPHEDFVVRRPHLRKLMQLEDEEETLGYENLKEELADDTKIYDENNKHGDRKKGIHDSDSQPNEKYDPGVYNPNWKGLLPLYPNEINSMIKQAVISANRFSLINPAKTVAGENEVPFNTKDISAEVDQAERNMKDVEYIEDYTNNKYDKLAEMAQAYSDYGVLDDKRDGIKNEKVGDKTTDHKVTLSVEQGLLKEGIFGRLKKDTFERPSEGLRLEVKPTSAASREDNPLEVYKLLQKYLKIFYKKDMKKPNVPNAGSSMDGVDLDVMYTPTMCDKCHTTEKKKKKTYNDKSDKSDNGFIFTLGRGKRSLKSIEQDDKYDFEFVSDHETDQENVTDIKNNTKMKSQTVNYINNKNDSQKTSDIEDHELKNYIVNINNIKIESPIQRRQNDDFPPEDPDGANNATYKITGKSIRVKRDTAMSNNNKEINMVNLIQNGTFNDFNNKSAISITYDDNKIKIVDHFYKGSENHILHNESKPKELNDTDKGMSLSDFFMFMSNLFRFMDVDNRGSQIENITSRTTMAKTDSSYDNVSGIVYPVYDSDMIDNIGHRSRVLMSIEDKNLTEKNEIEDGISKGDMIDIGKTVSANIINSSNITTIKDANNTKLEKKKCIKTNEGKNILENKILVKREADESSLTFWNDIYDDEYGVKVDPFENNLRSKHSAKKNNFIKSSGLWFQNKVKKVAEKIKKKADKSKENSSSYKVNRYSSKPISSSFKEKDGKKGISRRVGNFRSTVNPKKGRLHKRQLKILREDMESDKKDLTSLKVNMKEICRKAASEVQQTRNLEVREDTKEGAMASTLMQQLVRLMTDLVDYQVQQKTCLKLPPDLQNFLEWLVAPDQNKADVKFKSSFEDENNMDFGSVSNGDKSTEHYLDNTMQSTIDKEEFHLVDKPDPLATLQAVSDLIHQYELMSDDDKSKMTGIKEYLESQSDFLKKQAMPFYEFNMYPKTYYPMRFRRDLLYRSDRSNHAKKLRSRRKLSKFMKNVGKKHTKTTASYYEAVQITEAKKNNKNNPKLIDKKLTSKQIKRNLMDVYYKAVSDAKKITTVKNIDKKGEIH